jgi:formylglycine-generating enzyme required for sulfatase activity
VGACAAGCESGGDAPGDPGGAGSSGASGSGGSSGSSGASSGGASSGSSGATSPQSNDGIKDGDETDVDCGGTSGKTCAPGKGCLAPADCDSAVCAGGACAAPTPTDGVANADETDVDCGGAAAPKCAPTKRCKVHGDCAAGACLDGACSYARSCQSHYGGATCGAGEIGDPGVAHEDCCTPIAVPRPAASGGPFTMDKYLITAGRMRAFLAAVGEDVKSYVAADPPAGWSATWTASVPGNHADAAMQLGAGQSGATSYGASLGPGCYVKGMGAPAYWMPEADQIAYNGDVARALTQDQLDTKVMNCATRALFTAFCHWDGGRLPTFEEWKYAVNGGNAASTYPWGTAATIGTYASYDFNYAWPTNIPAAAADRGAELPAPGRFPQGKGPFGHMDLAGAVENFSSSSDGGWMQYSFQEAGKEQYGIVYGTRRTWVPSTKHWAVGARCVR